MITSDSIGGATIDQWIAEFESNWSPNSWSAVAARVAELPIEFAIEAARVDIDLRHMRGQSVDLRRYEVLERQVQESGWQGSPEGWRALIAYEDYRGVMRAGGPIDRNRWRMFLQPPWPTWYENLLSQDEERRDGTRTAALLPPPGESDLPTIGCKVGEFELLEQIGEGSFSKVYLAHQNSIGRRKVVLKFTTQDQQEPEWLGRFQHPNIVPIYSVHAWKQWAVLCMPFWGGLTLADWMRQQPISTARSARCLMDTLRSRSVAVDKEPGQRPTELSDSEVDRSSADVPSSNQTKQMLPLGDYLCEAIRLFRCLASGLHHAHQQGVLHGDIKPANILIREDGEPALLDFNLSQAAGDGTTMVKGTVPYMAPEQLEGWRNRTPVMTAATDIYSLGMVLFEHLVGQLPAEFRAPIDANNIDEVMQARSQFDFSASLQHVSPGLRSIVLKALDQDLSQRYRTAAEFEADLGLEAATRPLRYASEPWGPRVKKLLLRNRHRFTFTTVGLLCGAMTLVASVGAWQWRNSDLRRLATQASGEFIQNSELRLVDLHSADGGMDAQAADACVEALKQYAPKLFGESTRAAWSWLSGGEKQVLADAWSRHVVLTGFALARLQRDSKEMRPAWQIMERWGIAGEDATELNQRIESSAQGLPHAEALASPLPGLSAGNAAYFRAVVSGELADWKQCLRWLQSIPESQRESGMYWFLLGRTQLMFDQPEPAIVSFSLAKRSGAVIEPALVGRGLAYLKLRQLTEAMEDFSRALEIHPDNAELWMHRAICHQLSGQLDLALKDIDRACGLAPDRTTARFLRLQLLQGLGRNQEAQQEWQSTLQQEPKRSVDYVSRALARLPGDVTGAWRDLEFAERLEPASVAVWQNKAYVASEFQKNDLLAIECLDKLLAMRPNFAEGLSGRAVLHAREGFTPQAVLDIEKALEVTQAASGPTHYHAACVYALLSTGHPQYQSQSLAHLARALQLGYGFDLMQEDPDLAAIRMAPDYQAIAKINALSQVVSRQPQAESHPRESLQQEQP